MRTLLALTALLLTALPASAEALTLFEDPAGDVGPWPTFIVGRGAPAPADADLVRASLDDATVRLEVAVLDEPPADRIWTVGWSLDDGRFFAVGYDTPQGQARPGACVWPSRGQYAPEGEPTCVAVAAKVTPGSPGAFELEVPEEFLDGGKTNVSAAVLVTPDATLSPLGFAHYTGLTVVDVASGDDVAAASPATSLGSASVEIEGPNTVPAPGLLGGLLATAAVAVAVRRGVA